MEGFGIQSWQMGAAKCFSDGPGSAIYNGREAKSCLGRVFRSKLGRIARLLSKCMACVQNLLELKTRPRVCPVSLSLSIKIKKKMFLTLQVVKNLTIIFLNFKFFVKKHFNDKKLNNLQKKLYILLRNIIKVGSKKLSLQKINDFLSKYLFHQCPDTQQSDIQHKSAQNNIVLSVVILSVIELSVNIPSVLATRCLKFQSLIVTLTYSQNNRSSVCLSVFMSACLSDCLSSLHLSVSQSTRLSILLPPNSSTSL